jgi:hypothetical protein
MSLLPLLVTCGGNTVLFVVPYRKWKFGDLGGNKKFIVLEH